MGLSIFKGLDDRAGRASLRISFVSLEAVISWFRRKHLFELPVVFQELQVPILDRDVTGRLLKENLVFVLGAVEFFRPIFVHPVQDPIRIFSPLGPNDSLFSGAGLLRFFPEAKRRFFSASPPLRMMRLVAGVFPVREVQRTLGLMCNLWLMLND
jgi:hypothetical protein